MFLDKNRDILRSDLIDLLNSSKNKVRNLCGTFVFPQGEVMAVQEELIKYTQQLS